jgi:subtilisin family serine protease
MSKKPLLTLLSATVFTVAAALSVPSTSAVAGPAKAGKGALKGTKATAPQATNKIYIVRMSEAPAAAYDGKIRGLAATRPIRGEKLDVSKPDVARYRKYLDDRHDATLQKVGGRKIYSYGLVFNGFAAELTAAQAAKMAKTPGVLSVIKDELREVDTSSTPAFLGISNPGGLWDQVDGPEHAGEGIIVGIIDTGIWPENPSFKGENGEDHVRGWSGVCLDGEQFDASKACNRKLIGARYFDEGYGGDDALKAAKPWEFLSARDYNGHGSHTASTAAGNYRTKVDGPAAVFGRISGMAPAAMIASYKALWSTQDGSTASGFNSDLTAAIDQAVADGVDVINYSISGTSTNFMDPVEISFLFAADAGVFVSASAGNSGPTASTVAHPSPWITTVAAGTHNRNAVGTVKLGNGATYTGSGLANAAVTAPLINSTDAAAAGASATAVSLCYSKATNGGAPALDPAKVAGKIVVCDRGVSARVDKSLAVLEAGGVGMVLINPSASNIVADFHSVPTVHLQNTDYVAVHTYAATAGATATINKATFDYSAPAPFTASFSSRGPLLAGGGNLLKPDLMAPGQDILAAVSPSVGGLNFNLYSGTSMSAPHVAGLAALLKDRHHDWSPMMIKSALMTTAYDVLDGPGTNPSVIFSQGAGHVAPNKAADPGLVFDSNIVDWIGFICGTGQYNPANCTAAGIPVISTSNFNTPSIAISALAGSQTVTRTVTNVGSRGTYTVSTTGLAGFNVSVSPASFTLNPGQTKKLNITIQRTTAAIGAYAGGYITWTDRRHKVRVPVVVRPVIMAVPTQVSGSYSVKFGYDGAFAAAARGLVPATTFSDSVGNGDYPCYPVVVPAGSTYARFSLFNANTAPASDLDLDVYTDAGTLVGSSGSGTSDEEVNLRNPAPDTYWACVYGYATANPSTFTLFAWALGSTQESNMAITAPTSATLGATGNINLTFSGLTPGVKYLGSVAYSGVAGLPNPTIVRVDP